MSVNQERLAMWTAALRSGEYRQGYGRLHTATQDGPRYCCLGVLCEVSGVEYDRQKALPPGAVREWLGDPAWVLGNGDGRHMTGLNDLGGHTFDQIADLIDTHGLAAS